MDLPPEAVEEFKQIYKRETNIDLNDADAKALANKLFSFMNLVLVTNLLSK